jgi:hypothetical protein
MTPHQQHIAVRKMKSLVGAEDSSWFGKIWSNAFNKQLNRSPSECAKEVDKEEFCLYEVIHQFKQFKLNLTLKIIANRTRE